MFHDYKNAKKCPKKSEIWAYCDSDDSHDDEEFYERKTSIRFTLQVWGMILLRTSSYGGLGYERWDCLESILFHDLLPFCFYRIFIFHLFALLSIIAQNENFAIGKIRFFLQKKWKMKFMFWTQFLRFFFIFLKYYCEPGSKLCSLNSSRMQFIVLHGNKLGWSWKKLSWKI